MAYTNGNANRKSYILAVEPVTYSLTAGTNIPAPLDSPPRTPAETIRPPTPGGGPLTSHPTTPDNVPSNLPPTPEADKQDSVTKTNSKPNAWQTRNDSFRTPMSPASASATNITSPNQHHVPIQQDEQPRRRPSGVRKLLSLTNLRSSFSSSRTSLALPRASQDNQSTISSLKRPASPSMASTTGGASSAWSEKQQPPQQQQRRPQLREKKSSGWFKRKSGFFGSADMPLDAVDEDQRPDTRESKRVKESKSAPLLPELGTFGGGGLVTGGDLGWDERQFQR